MNLDHKSALVLAILWSTVVACSQATPATALPEDVRDIVKNERFQLVTSIRGMPIGVRDALQTLFGSETLDIAESSEAFQVDDMVHPSLKSRRLVASWCTIEYCLVHYERGGEAHTWHVALFHWTPAATRFVWGGTAPSRLATIDDLRNAILSGAIKGPATIW
jgi:predicted benzoate:H+ symporter BenE